MGPRTYRVLALVVLTLGVVAGIVIVRQRRMIQDYERAVNASRQRTTSPRLRDLLKEMETQGLERQEREQGEKIQRMESENRLMKSQLSEAESGLSSLKWQIRELQTTVRDESMRDESIGDKVTKLLNYHDSYREYNEKEERQRRIDDSFKSVFRDIDRVDESITTKPYSFERPVSTYRSYLP